MANKFTIADMEAHFGVGKHVQAVIDWSATGITEILGAACHPKMRVKTIVVTNCNAALNGTEPIINVVHGANEVVATIDMATGMAATAAIGYVDNLTIVEAYRILEVNDALKVEVETANGAGASVGKFDFEYELVE